MAARAPEPMWVRITVTVSADAAPGIADLLLSLAHGVEEQPSAAGVRLVAYLPADSDVEGAVKHLRERLEALRSADVAMGQGRVARRRVRSQVWQEAWKAGFDVVRVGQQLAIKPTWKEYAAAPGEVVVELDPGMAFGTGQHATTRGCLVALANLVRPGMTVFDIGSGSGILAIAAAKLGARRVIAVEINESVARIARSNVALNSVADGVLVMCGDRLRCICGRADIIIANLTSDQIARMAPDVILYLRPKGVFVASGIALEQEADVRKALSRAGLVLREPQREEEWVTMTWELSRDASVAG
ncbi:MAG: 50S ribosomal protein L11 methyltransferase [Armatimonadota bacterium]|nr:MAG: 50S ribosomal protein L11 methyltransferase [Armatimonadota bacterium]